MLNITGIVSNIIQNFKPIAPTVKKKFGYCKIQDKSGQIIVTLTPLTMNNKTFAFIMCS